ncbi:beta-lactamase class A [Enterococcus sp. AZ194]|uniref:serine hydrolase n=1 Tax=Enterococcus sp. AZ194 TaxID=2774629 RepID=UPI003F24F637
MNTKNKQLNIIICISVIVALLFALVGLNRFGKDVQAKEQKAQQLQHEKAQQALQERNNQKMEAFYQQIQTLIDQKKSLKSEAIGISFYDVTTSRELSLNGDTEFKAASTSKVALALLIADKIQEGELSLDTQLYYTADDYEDGTGYIINHEIEKSYSVELLMNYMLVYSDNIATNMLYREVGDREEARKQFRDNYLPDLNVNGNQLTANQARDLLLHLHENYEANPVYIKIMEWLKQTDFPIRLATNQTSDFLAHKIGSVDNGVHDIGFFDTEHPYILTVYSKGLPNAEAELSSLSDQIYQLMTQSYPDLEK